MQTDNALLAEFHTQTDAPPVLTAKKIQTEAPPAQISAGLQTDVKEECEMEMQTDEKEVTEKKMQTDTPLTLSNSVQTEKLEQKQQLIQAGPSFYPEFVDGETQVEVQVNQDVETIDLASNEIINVVVIPPPPAIQIEEKQQKRASIKGKPKFDLSINTDEESKEQLDLIKMPSTVTAQSSKPLELENIEHLKT